MAIELWAYRLGGSEEFHAAAIVGGAVEFFCDAPGDVAAATRSLPVGCPACRASLRVLRREAEAELARREFRRKSFATLSSGAVS